MPALSGDATTVDGLADGDHIVSASLATSWKESTETVSWRKVPLEERPIETYLKTYPVFVSRLRMISRFASQVVMRLLMAFAMLSLAVPVLLKTSL